jgi:tetratricopeptide (TPR) repeat protein
MCIPISLLLAMVVLPPMADQAPAEDPMAIVQRAYQSQQNGDYAAAAEAYRAFLKLRPQEVGAHSNLGVVLTKLGRYDEAIHEYEAAEKLMPSDSRIAINLALAYEKSGRLFDARKKLETLHAEAPQEKQVTMLLADACLQAGENSRVIALLQPLEQQTPDDLAVSYLLGTSLVRSQRVSEGQVLLDRILRNGDSAESRFLLGTQMYESGDYPAAVRQLSAASAVNPNLAELQAYLGQALLATGDPDGAVAAFRRELQQNPNNYESNLGLGQILTVRKNLVDAEQLLSQAVRMRPQSAKAILSLGECLSAEGKWNDARPSLQTAVKMLPDSAEAHEQLATVYTRLHLTREAVRERSTANRLHQSSTAQNPLAGPKRNELAPDFTLPDVATGKNVSLSDFRGKCPVVLIFGSYTCPNFRSSADALKAIYAKYAAQARFLLVYIREAHAIGDWQSTRNERDGVVLPPAQGLAEKQNHAAMCTRTLHLPFQALLDGLDNKVESAFAAWPSRAFVIGTDGRILYSTRLTELDFSADDMKTALQNADKTRRRSAISTTRPSSGSSH